MNLYAMVNQPTSVLGKDLLEWLNTNPSTLPNEEATVVVKLYNKYVVDRNGNPRENKIFPEVYYYIHYDNHLNAAMYTAYITRDKLKSPRRVPEGVANTTIVDTQQSYKGSFIRDWAYYQNGSASHPFYVEGCDIVTKYIEGKYPIKRDTYYFCVSTAKGLRLMRDENKSPREYILPTGGNNNEASPTNQSAEV